MYRIWATGILVSGADAEDQFAKVHVELNAHLYYGAAEAPLTWALDRGFTACGFRG